MNIEIAMLSRANTLLKPAAHRIQWRVGTWNEEMQPIVFHSSFSQSDWNSYIRRWWKLVFRQMFQPKHCISSKARSSFLCDTMTIIQKGQHLAMGFYINGKIGNDIDLCPMSEVNHSVLGKLQAVVHAQRLNSPTVVLTFHTLLMIRIFEHWNI